MKEQLLAFISLKRQLISKDSEIFRAGQYPEVSTFLVHQALRIVAPRLGHRGYSDRNFLAVNVEGRTVLIAARRPGNTVLAELYRHFRSRNDVNGS